MCEDGNLISGDGCSENCIVEKGYVCTPPPGSIGNAKYIFILFNNNFIFF